MCSRVSCIRARLGSAAASPVLMSSTRSSSSKAWASLASASERGPERAQAATIVRIFMYRFFLLLPAAHSVVRPERVHGEAGYAAHHVARTRQDRELVCTQHRDAEPQPSRPTELFERQQPPCG